MFRYLLILGVICSLFLISTPESKAPPPPTGACCGCTLGGCTTGPSGMCGINEEKTCEEFNGTYKGDDTTCDPDPCVTACSDCVNEADCNDDCNTNVPNCQWCAGTMQCIDMGIRCLILIPTGACCFENDECAVGIVQLCVGEGGSYLGDDVSCTGLLSHRNRCYHS